MIDGYLKSQVEMDDHVIHLLFSANRWEAAYGFSPLIPIPLSLSSLSFPMPSLYKKKTFGRCIMHIKKHTTNNNQPQQQQ